MLDLPISRRIVQLYLIVEIQEYISSILKQSVTEYINNKNNFLLCFKGIRCNKLEIDFNNGGGRLGHLDLVTHPDMNPVQPSLTLVNRREPVFSKGNTHQVFCYISFSNDEQFRRKFFLRSKLYKYFSPSDIPSNNENNKFN